MDIEGAEFRVLQSASSSLLSRFRIMVIEFHDLSSLVTPFGLREILSLWKNS
jgi:Methyltransferase FkbM domain